MQFLSPHSYKKFSLEEVYHWICLYGGSRKFFARTLYIHLKTYKETKSVFTAN